MKIKLKKGSKTCFRRAEAARSVATKLFSLHVDFSFGVSRKFSNHPYEIIVKDDIEVSEGYLERIERVTKGIIVAPL